MCCHPALTRPSAIALTLRAVGGLTTAEIANAFLVPEATMAQRISRAKQRIKTSGVPFRMPTDGERAERLERRPARALPDLQRGLHQQHRPEPAAHRSVERGDPADARRAQPPAGRWRGRGTAGADAADRCPAPGADRARRRADPARRAGSNAVGSARHRRGRRAHQRRRCPEGRSARISCRPRSRPCTTKRRAPRTPTGRRSWRCMACSSACPTIRW